MLLSVLQSVRPKLNLVRGLPHNTLCVLLYM
nr:MAG TPA: hypothetical protein [Caudoviricetes sp.]